MLAGVLGDVPLLDLMEPYLTRWKCVGQDSSPDEVPDAMTSLTRLAALARPPRSVDPLMQLKQCRCEEVLRKVSM